MRVLLTGSAGFIGAATARRLLTAGHEVVGVDSINDYYDVALKHARLDTLRQYSGFTSVCSDISDADATKSIFRNVEPSHVIHLAAQAGVRYASQNPEAYGRSNLVGFLNILEGCRTARVEHLIFASSSSVYGSNRSLPFSERQVTMHPLNLYAATKQANESMAHAYSHMFGLPATGLRFFTVYGPWGRPDMAPMLFTRSILAGEPIKVFNHGRHTRSFTYIDDIVEGIVRAAAIPPRRREQWDPYRPDPGSSGVADYRVYNIGAEKPVELKRFITLLEREIGRPAKLEYLPLQIGDVPDTEADVSDLVALTGFRPSTSVETGVRELVSWYRSFYP